MHVLVTHSDDRPFEVERFGAAWQAAGGGRAELAFVTPSTLTRVLAQVVGSVAGVLLTGGPDVAPERYGATPIPGVELHRDGARDALDLNLLACSEREGWPVLAVCYGIQVLNVFHGGTLVQDLERAGLPGHRVPQPKDALAHEVALVPGGRAFAGLPERFQVNSRHHQAIDTLAPRLRPLACAADGLVEAVELADGDRVVVGVQWHPENLLFEPHLEVFRRFRAACLARAA